MSELITQLLGLDLLIFLLLEVEFASKDLQDECNDLDKESLLSFLEESPVFLEVEVPCNELDKKSPLFLLELDALLFLEDKDSDDDFFWSCEERSPPNDFEDEIVLSCERRPPHSSSTSESPLKIFLEELPVLFLEVVEAPCKDVDKDLEEDDFFI